MSLAAKFLLPIAGPKIGALKLWVPMHPHPKQRARGGRGHHFDTSKNRASEGKIQRAFITRYGNNPVIDRLPHAGPFKVTIYNLYQLSKNSWPGRDVDDSTVAGDVDNLAKTVFDALNGRLWTDDTWILGLHVEKFFWRYAGVLMICEFHEPTSRTIGENLCQEKNSTVARLNALLSV